MGDSISVGTVSLGPCTPGVSEGCKRVRLLAVNNLPHLLTLVSACLLCSLVLVLACFCLYLTSLAFAGFLGPHTPGLLPPPVWHFRPQALDGDAYVTDHVVQ